MFNLPKCPYCNTIYRYDDVKKTVKEKNHSCYHCKKTFKVSKKGLAVLFAITVIVAVIVNIIELNIFANMNIIALTVTNIIIITVFIFFIPFFINYVKTENKDKMNKKKKK